jgi:hypothetical protein
MDPTQITLLEIGASAIVSAGIGSIVTDFRYAKGKKIVKKIRIFIDGLDDMIYDDKVTEDEFRKQWEYGKGLVDAVMSKEDAAKA